MFRTAGVIIALIAANSSALAQSTLSGPSLGFVFDADAKSIRPILGIPGAASLGKPLDLGVDFVKAAVSPQEDYILAFTSASSLLLIRSDNGAISSDAVPGVSGVPDLIAVSPAGQSAVLYYRRTAVLQIVTGLPASVAIGPSLDVSGLPDSLDSLGIADNAKNVIAGVPENTIPDSPSGELFVIPVDGSAPRSILTLGHASAVTLFNNSTDALVTDDVKNALLLVSDVMGTAVTAQLFGPEAQIVQPLAVQPSNDNQKYIVASKSGTIAVIDAGGADPVTLQCTCTPTGLHRLNGRASFQLTDPADGLIWLLDWDPLEPRLLFVPPATDGNQTDEQFGVERRK